MDSGVQLPTRKQILASCQVAKRMGFVRIAKMLKSPEPQPR